MHLIINSLPPSSSLLQAARLSQAAPASLLLTVQKSRPEQPPASGAVPSHRLFWTQGLGFFPAVKMQIPQEYSISQKLAISSTTSFFKNEVLIRQLGTSQNIHCLSYFSVFKMSQIFRNKIGRDALINPKQMFGFFPSQNSAWQNFLKFPVSLHFRVTEPNWSISHEMEDLGLTEITAAFPRHVRNFPVVVPCHFPTPQQP